MKKRMIFVFLLFLLLSLVLLSFGSSILDSIDSEIKKITYYAQEYETGNINYVRLLLYSSAVRERINEVLGAEKKEGGLLKEEQLRAMFGEPTERTKWVWFEKEERERKLEQEVDVWKRIIFDGNKIQIWLNAWPSIFSNQDSKEERLIYRLNFEINFKKPQEELNINQKISDIQNLAVEFNKNPVKENAETLARESVNVEKTFESFMRQNQGNCQDTMKSIFGSENIRETQKLLAQEIDFFSGEDFELRMRLEMCDECEWNWVNLNFWVEGRGPDFKEPKQLEKEITTKEFESMPEIEIQNTIKQDLENLKQYLSQRDFSSALLLNSKFQQLNDAWNRKANDVWSQVESSFKSSKETLTPEQMEEYNRNYGWLKEEQKKKQLEKEIRKENYENRKNFYLSLFSNYEKKEFYFEQAEYEKRLVEEFKEFGKETCDNNQDDNNNNQIDCSDEQCLGKICGKQRVSAMKGNETIEETRELYCIAKECKLKDETIEEKKELVCGNHVCESGEEQSCTKDCSQCKSYEAIECFGKVIFKGTDENGCALEPICLNETNYCQATSDCVQPLCGKAECIENKCELMRLEECREAECIEGDEKIQNCRDGNIVAEKCIDGLWKKTGIECQNIGINETEELISKEQIAENECVVKEDCGNLNDVCSNGKCVTIPQAISIQPIQELQTQEQKNSPAGQIEETKQGTQILESVETTETITGAVINTIRTISGKIIGFVITGFEVEEQETKTQVIPTQPALEQIEQQTKQELLEETKQIEEKPALQQNEQQENLQQNQEEQGRGDENNRQREDEQKEESEREQQEREEREQQGRREELERRARECDENCNGQCSDMLILPCVDSCVRKAECLGENCLEKEINKCENECKKEKNFDNCINDCSDKCKKGEKFEIKQEQSEEHKEEKGVFRAGGTCRISPQKTESFIFFDGWGEPFENLRYLKPKYYSGGQAEWCKNDLDNLIKQRKEIVQGLNDEFVKWFFEKYLANSAEEWEQHVSGIFELYWKDVDVSREMAYRMNCLDKKELNFTPNLINIKYETEFGRLEFWEEIKTAKIPGLDKETQIISPYMRIWIFPSKEFIKYQMKKSMKNHEFPGPSEEKIEGGAGPTEEEKAEIRKDESIMKKIREISERYGGNADIAVQFKDYTTNETIFNLYVQVNEKDIIKIEPMLAEEIPQKDVIIEMDFEKLYDIIYTSEKEMKGEQLESPPWDKKPRTQKIKEIYNGIKMYFKVRSMINDAKIYPESEEEIARGMIKDFLTMMMKKGMQGEGQPEEKTQENSEELTAKVIFTKVEGI